MMSHNVIFCYTGSVAKYKRYCATLKISHNIVPETMEKNKKIDSPLYRYINEFLEYCEIGKNQSQNTISAYYRYLNKFLTFALKEGVDDPKKIDLVTVNRYRLYLNRLSNDKGNQLKLITQNYHLIALRAFLKYLIKRYCCVSPLLLRNSGSSR